MSLLVHLRQLEHESLRLRGTLSAEELGLEGFDELVHPTSGLEYNLVASRQERSVLLQGSLRIQLRCECARCLKPSERRIELSDWAQLLALEGEDRIPLTHDAVDLTPILREDILLAFPQHPLCEPECAGLPRVAPVGDQGRLAPQFEGMKSSAWAELNKLKLKE